MYVILQSVMSASLAALLIMTICALIAKKSLLDREKMTPFECGFDPKSSSRIPFSIQFFLIAILFLIFDIEIVIIIPMIITLKTSIIMNWTMTSLTFIFILIGGLYYEWNNSMLEWTQ